MNSWQYCYIAASDFSMYLITVQLSNRYLTDTNCTLVLSWKTKEGTYYT